MSNHTWNIGDQPIVETPVTLHPRASAITAMSCTFTKPDKTTEVVVSMTEDAGTWWCTGPVLDVAGVWTWKATSTAGAHASDTGAFTVLP